MPNILYKALTDNYVGQMSFYIFTNGIPLSFINLMDFPLKCRIVSYESEANFSVWRIDPIALHFVETFACAAYSQGQPS